MSERKPVGIVIPTESAWHAHQRGYREAIEAAARVAEAAPWFVEMGLDHIRKMRGTDIAQSIRALLPKDAVSEGERK